MKKIFVNSKNQAAFRCHACGREEMKDVSRFFSLDKEIRLKWTCACGQANTVMLERRQFFRENVRLPGSYSLDRQDGRTIINPVTIVAISHRGLSFKQGLSSRAPNFQPGDRLQVQFTLDDRLKSVVSREVVVRSVKGSIVGVEFTSLQHADNLGNYLLFQQD